MAEQKYLGKEILEIDDIVFEEVDVPEWGGIMLVQSLSGAERDAYELSIIVIKGKKTSLDMKNMRARLVAMSVIDGETTRNRVFSDRDVTKLGNKSGKALDRVFSVCQRISGLESDSLQGALENLALTPGEGSTSN